MIQWMLAIWSLVALPFLNPPSTSRSCWFKYCWSLLWRILSLTLLACEMSTVVWHFEHSLTLSFFGIGMNLIFSSSVVTADFYKFAGVLSVALSGSSLRILNNSAGISSLPHVLFIIMLSRAHLTSHSRMFCTKLVTTPLWLSWSLRLFLNHSLALAKGLA